MTKRWHRFWFWKLDDSDDFYVSFTITRASIELMIMRWSMGVYF